MKSALLNLGNLESVTLLVEMCLSVSLIAKIIISWRGIFREPLSLSKKPETVFKVVPPRKTKTWRTGAEAIE